MNRRDFVVASTGLALFGLSGLAKTEECSFENIYFWDISHVPIGEKRAVRLKGERYYYKKLSERRVEVDLGGNTSVWVDACKYSSGTPNRKLSTFSLLWDDARAVRDCHGQPTLVFIHSIQNEPHTNYLISIIAPGPKRRPTNLRGQ